MLLCLVCLSRLFCTVEKKLLNEIELCQPDSIWVLPELAIVALHCNTFKYIRKRNSAAGATIYITTCYNSSFWIYVQVEWSIMLWKVSMVWHPFTHRLSNSSIAEFCSLFRLNIFSIWFETLKTFGQVPWLLQLQTYLP